MGATLIFDTLQYANKLKHAGVPDKQAEIQAEALAEIINEKVATKEDLKKLKYELKYELLMWMFGLLTVQSTVIISYIKLLH